MSTSCVSESKAKARELAAFRSGQADGVAKAQTLQGANITILGPVRLRSLPWKEDLTLSKAIIQAGYEGERDPNLFLIIRGGKPIAVQPRQLLQGEDFPLQAGDVVEIRP